MLEHFFNSKSESKSKCDWIEPIFTLSYFSRQAFEATTYSDNVSGVLIFSINVVTSVLVDVFVAYVNTLNAIYQNDKDSEKESRGR